MSDLKKENSYNYEGKSFKGYLLPSNPLIVALTAVFMALIYIITAFFAIPVPATGGYINLGDMLVMFTALLFGPIVGGLAGGFGSMLADILSPYYIYAPATLLIKGIEGFLIGLISNPRNNNSRVSFRDLMAVIIGGIIIPLGYFLYEAFVLNLGVAVALVEVPGNFFQFGFAAISSIILITATRKNLITNFPQVFNKVFILQF
ncbi:MAG: ECF transporter S component [Promethearchaeota archaeon]|nr:MAG: ECF transporter S component [Candidatus Lokiarchaeota archaeon]